jgi:hypothetical protein
VPDVVHFQIMPKREKSEGPKSDREKLSALIKEALELRQRADKLLDQSEALKKKIEGRKR